jgi:cytochrome d ubiquinol oxidase subunit II
MTLNAIWFILLFVLLGGYAVLDGFDFGVGMLHLLHRDDKTRRRFLNAIAPVWDGNEVWLLTGGGALFAAFPIVYATVFSGFYIALMLVLAALIFRAVSMEFRSKVDNARWRKVWDIAFGVSSLVLALLFGVAFGNVLRGVPLTADGTYAGSFFSLLNPYALLVGLLGVALFFMHGAIYLTCKTSGPVRARLSALASNSWRVVSVMIIAVTAATLMLAPSLTQSLGVSPLPWIAGALLVAACVVIPMCLEAARFRTAFVASSAVICCLMALAAIGLFPRLLPCLNDPSASLTIYNSSSSATTLGVMLIIALIGMPLVIGYTFLIHRVFRGSESIARDSY